jgi:hypothetical protein
MPSKFAESRNLNQMLALGLSDEARKAVNAAFDAISTWRTETVNTSDKTSSGSSTSWLRLREP